MKFLLLAALCCLALAASPRQRWTDTPRGDITESHFRADREYRYTYDGQIASGMPQGSPQHATTRLQALIKIIFKRENVALLKLEDVRLGNLLRELQTPRELLPFGVFEEKEMSEKHSRVISLPLRFRYENGLVSQIEFDGEDQPWSMNIKRSVLNMLQMNIKKHGVRNVDSEESRLWKLDESLEETTDFFTVQEPTLEGDCETMYTINKLPAESRNVFNVSKSINFEKCRERTDIRYNLRFGEECEGCDSKFTQEERNTKSSTVMNFNVSGTPDKFMIEGVEVKSLYTYAPFSSEENLLQTYVCSRLQLVQADKIEREIEEPKKVEEKETLLFSAKWDQMKEKFHMTGDEGFLSESSLFVELKNKPEVVVAIVKRYLAAINNKERGIEADVTRQVARLVKILRLSTSEDLDKIHRELYNNEKSFEEDSKKVHDLFVDCLALAGTKHTIEFLVEKVIDRKITPIRASLSLKSLINDRTVSEQHIDSVLRLCKHEISERNPVLRQSCWLTVGSLINGLCKDNQDRLAVEISEELKNKQCSRSLKEKYVEELVRFYRQATTKYEKVLALKTMANAAIDISVFEIEKLIHSREEKVVRMAAIDALRQLRSVMPRKLHKILMPIVKNRFESPEIRMAAVAQIMHTIPERSVLDQLSQMLYNERSHQVHSFVYSMMRTFANSTNPCEQRLAEDLQVSLRHARVQPENILDSKYIHLPLYSQTYKTGASLNLAAMLSNDSFIPKEVMASLDVAFAGQWKKYSAQLGFVQQNAEQLLEQLINMVYGEESRRSESVESLRNLFSKMNIRNRRERSEEPHAMLYIRYKDLDYAVLPLAEESMPESLKNVIRNKRFDISEITRFLAQGYAFNTQMSWYMYEVSRKIPTTFGMPLVISGKMPVVATIRGHIKVNNGELRIVAEPSIATTHITEMELWCPLLNSGVKVAQHLQVNIPTDVKIIPSYRNEKAELKVIVKTPESERRIMSLQTRPTVYARTWPKESRSYIEPKEVTMYSEEMEQRLRNYEHNFGEKTLGLIFNVVGQMHKNPIQRIRGQPIPLLATENFVELTVRPGSKRPTEIVFTLEAEAFVPQSKLPTPRFEKFFEEEKSDERDLFETESHEEQSEDENQRRSQFNKYSKNYSAKQVYLHRVKAVVEAVGPVERKASLELKATCDNEGRFCETVVEAERSPIEEMKETRKWNLKTLIQTLYPEVATSLKELKEQKHREFHAKIESTWGSSEKSTVEIKIQGEQNREQKKWISRVEKLSERKPNDMYEILIAAAQLNQYKLVADYKLSPIVENATNSLYNLIKYAGYWSSDMKLVQKEEGKMFAQLTIDPRTRQYVNLTIQTPSERVIFSDVLLPVRITPLNIIRKSVSPISSVRELVDDVTSSRKAECRVESSRVETFDNVVYKAPLTTCYSVLAKDCRDSANPSFVVMMKKVSKNSEEKKIKIVSGKNVVEIEKVSSELKVKINGKVVRDVERMEEENIYKHGETLVVKLESEGVIVRFDGYSAQVKISSFYKNGQCGMCGHYDDERDDELRTADNELTEDIEEFHRSFFNKDEECQIEEDKVSERKQYKLLSQEESQEEQERYFESSEEVQRDEREEQRQNRRRPTSEERDDEEREETPVLKTRVIEYNHELCFSTKPVPVCEPRMHETETTEKKVQFACVSRSSPEARRLAREARKTVVNMDSYKLSFVETLPVPVKCAQL